MSLLEALVYILGDPGSKAKLQIVRNRRCAYQSRITSLLDDARHGSGVHGSSSRVRERTRKGSEIKNQQRKK
jgi:hypothetical protein